jgi:hypothetical protein
MKNFFWLIIIIATIIVSVFIVYFPSLTEEANTAETKTNSPKKLIIGYGTSNAVLSQKEQQDFISGFLIGFEKHLGKDLKSELEKKYNTKDSNLYEIQPLYDYSPLGAMRIAKDFEEREAMLLIGFTTSHEALQAAEIAQKNRILFISSAAGHPNLAKMGNTVYTLGEPMDVFVEKILKEADRLFPGKKGYLIINRQEAFSVAQESIFDKIMQEKHYSITLEKMYLQCKGTVQKIGILSEEPEKNDIRKIADDMNQSFLCLTTYPEKSLDLLQQFKEKKIDMPIITSSAWGLGDIKEIREFLKEKKQSVYGPTIWSTDSHRYTTLKNDLELAGRKDILPNAEIAMGFDLGIIVAELIIRMRDELLIGDDLLNGGNRAKLIKNRERFIEKFREIIKDKNFWDTQSQNNFASGSIDFVNAQEGGYATRNLYLVYFDKNIQDYKKLKNE